ncbi:thiamine phosphate synthase [Sinimarinibacterium thermocellulolyticum]|uniref:Thiamine-phosphate synthase n=1 Tax=Sinimarinibacterium thermocellulolyticum TaxID=3170016 RepID=A0ABV2ACE7_9GAMM
MSVRRPLRGLYAITPDALVADPPSLLAAAAAALRGGAVLLQYRDKRSAAAQRLALARELAALCRQHEAALIVNDNAALALAVGAQGVHLGAADGRAEDARALLGNKAIIGVTCGNDLARAQAAIDAGADYVAFGRLYPSRSKPEAPAAELDTLRAARARWNVTICGIGGISAALAPQVIAAGADLVAAIDGVFGAADVEAAARAYASAFAGSCG